MLPFPSRPVPLCSHAHALRYFYGAGFTNETVFEVLVLAEELTPEGGPWPCRVVRLFNENVALGEHPAIPPRICETPDAGHEGQ